MPHFAGSAAGKNPLIRWHILLQVSAKFKYMLGHSAELKHGNADGSSRQARIVGSVRK